MTDILVAPARVLSDFSHRLVSSDAASPIAVALPHIHPSEIRIHPSLCSSVLKQRFVAK
jgi:hypothetical protein